MKKAVRTATLGCRHCRLERVTGIGLACGLGHSAALTPHCGVIHYRFAFDSYFVLGIRTQYQTVLRSLLERVTGIEPAASAWEAEVLPLDYTREQLYCTLFARICQELFGNYPPKSKIIFSACRKRRKIRSSLSKEREKSDFSVASISSATRGRWRIPRRWFERISESARQRLASFSPRPIRRR